MKHDSYDVIEFGDLIVDASEQVVLYRGQEISFTNREFQVLYFLIRYRGQVFSKEQIYNQVTGQDENDVFHTVEITISRIRKKLKTYSGRKSTSCSGYSNSGHSVH